MEKKMLSVKLKKSKNSLVSLPIGFEKEEKKNTLIKRIKYKWQSGYQKIKSNKF
jgi:hypothetical protein